MASDERSSDPASEPHRHRDAAESFGTDPARYDRARPRYPAALIDRIVATPAVDILDVGTATGIAARQLQAAGCRVVGVDPDARLAAFARRSGLEVEVARFEDWDPAGRRFDAVVAGESWHWVDPAVGTAKAAGLLRPGGRLFVFWNTGQPQAGLDDAFVEVYRRVLPAIADRLTAATMVAAHVAMSAAAVEGIRATGSFEEPEQWRLEWEQDYTRDEWLDALQTSGGAVPAGSLAGLLDGIGAAIDGVGGTFTMRYATFVVTARRRA